MQRALGENTQNRRGGDRRRYQKQDDAHLGFLRHIHELLCARPCFSIIIPEQDMPLGACAGHSARASDHDWSVKGELIGTRKELP